MPSLEHSKETSAPRPTGAGAAHHRQAISARVRPIPPSEQSEAVARGETRGGRTGKLRGRPSRSLHHTRDRGDGRGLNPPPDERGPAVVEYDDAPILTLDDL
jgi:hypothetical protein